MGFFSWKTSDTNESISNQHSPLGALPVKMLDNKGNVWIEKKYDGYGEFGGKDFYSLLAEMNERGSSREAGIDMFFDGDIASIQPKLVTIDCNQSWDDLPNSPDCDSQGFWYDDDEEEY